jgi:signal transduction histidine kinase
MYEKENSIKHLILLIGFLLLFLLVIYFYYVFKYHKKSIKLYTEKLSAEMTGREEERKRISKDLHDELGSTLIGANMYLQVLNGDVDHDKQIISKVKSSISRSLEQIKQIINDLYPISLENYGLISSLNEFIDEMNQLSRVNIIFTNLVQNLETKILKEHKIHIFRIIMEISQNTMKYSKSPVLSLRFSENNNKIVLETIDQGHGFDANDNSVRRKGHGLKNIINRVELINAVVFLDASPKKGVHYTIEIPIPNAAEQD